MAKKAKATPRADGARAAAAAGLLGLMGGANPLSGIASPQNRYAPTPFVPNRESATPAPKRKGK